MKIRTLCSAFIMASLATSCEDIGKRVPTGFPAAEKSAIDAALSEISPMKLFFGHKSVGKNLLDGLAELSSPSVTSGLRFIETRSPSRISEAGIYHAFIGENGNPLGKIEEFDEIIRDGVGEKVDAAFLKFCYADISADTDVETLFSVYKETMGRLAADFPRVKFIHFTAPITQDRRGLVAQLKRILGRPVQGYEQNVVREKYNTMIRAEYGASGTVFDLAAIESSSESGIAEVKSIGSENYYLLKDEYTDDGGHLNESGRRFVSGWLAVELGRMLP